MHILEKNLYSNKI